MTLIEEIIDLVSNLTKVSGKTLHEQQEIEDHWDSFSKVEIALALESRFEVDFSAEEITECRSIKKINQILETKGIKTIEGTSD